MTTVSHVRTSAGSTISICAATLPATYDIPGFSALTYVPVAEITDLGSLGKTYTVTKFMPLGSRSVVKRKGSYDNGTMTVKGGYSPTDAGQQAIQAGRDSDTSSSFKMVTQSGTTYYFTSQVSSYVIGTGTVDQITDITIALDIDNDILVTNITV